MSDPVQDLANMLADLFKSRNKEYVEIATQDIVGETGNIFKEVDFVKLLTQRLEDLEVHLAVEADYSTIFLMSKTYFEDMCKTGTELDPEQYQKMLAGFPSYAAFLEHVNKNQKH